MDITSLPRVPGALKRRKIVGRGIGSGHGKTSTRGQKGQRARTGSQKRPGFEGSRMPLIRRVPKRGFRRKAHGREIVREIINLDSLNRFADGQRVTPEVLREAGLVNDTTSRIKLLGDGALKKKVMIAVHQASAAAKAKVSQAGGTIELIVQGSRFKVQGSKAGPRTSNPEPRT